MKAFFVRSYDGANDSERVHACLQEANAYDGEKQIVFEGRDFELSEAVLLSSDTTCVIDNCVIRQCDFTFDNVFRGDNLTFASENPNGYAVSACPLKNVRILGKGRARVDGCVRNRRGWHSVLGEEQEMVGDFWGWRTTQVCLTHCDGFEIGGIEFTRTRCWALVFSMCSNGSIHDLRFDSHVKNGDGIDLRIGCHHIDIRDIFGYTSDDCVACTAMYTPNISYPYRNYLYPMIPDYEQMEPDNPRRLDIHDISVRRITTSGQCHRMILYAGGGPHVYNIHARGIVELADSKDECVVKVYSGGYTALCEPGAIHDVQLADIYAATSSFAVMCNVPVRNMTLRNVMPAPNGYRYGLKYAQNITLDESESDMCEELRRLALGVLADCTFVTECDYLGEKGVSRVLVPSGDGKYPSFWVRDCAMMCVSGLVALDDWRRYLLIIASHGQNGERESMLEHGLRVPPFALADHVNFNGKPVFYPGTLSDVNDQGAGRFGFLPPLCDNYWFAMMAAAYLRNSGDLELLDVDCAGITFRERLREAMRGYCIDKQTGLCACLEDERAVDWGFTDCVVKDGRLLMPSLFRWDAARQLRAFVELDDLANWDALARSIVETFFDENSGWLYSATGHGHQWDVWGTAYAASCGLLSDERLHKARAALAEGYRSGDTVRFGYVRHLPSAADANERTAWDCVPGSEKGQYQNGAYWATPVGWYCAALKGEYEALARELIEDFLAHTRKHAKQGAPFEFIDARDVCFSGARYGTSATMPYWGFKECCQL